MDMNANISAHLFRIFLVCLARPFWLSPRQVMVVPVGPASEEYAQQVRVGPSLFIVGNFNSSLSPCPRTKSECLSNFGDILGGMVCRES